MWFVVIGVIMLVMNLAGFGPVGAWTWADDWWKLLLPFGLAIVWWLWADSTGWTQRKAMEKVDEKREARRQKQLDALGMGETKGKRR
jgi:small Trp-rich protein